MAISKSSSLHCKTTRSTICALLIPMDTLFHYPCKHLSTKTSFLKCLSQILFISTYDNCIEELTFHIPPIKYTRLNGSMVIFTYWEAINQHSQRNVQLRQHPWTLVPCKYPLWAQPETVIKFTEIKVLAVAFWKGQAMCYNAKGGIYTWWIVEVFHFIFNSFSSIDFVCTSKKQKHSMDRTLKIQFCLFECPGKGDYMMGK